MNVFVPRIYKSNDCPKRSRSPLQSSPTDAQCLSDPVDIRNRKLCCLLAFIPFLASCNVSFDRPYESEFVGELLKPPEVLLEGKALVWTTEEEDAYQWEWFRGSSDSLFLGEITREIAMSVFSQIFTGGTEHATTLDNVDDYEIVITPRPIAFDGSFNSGEEFLGAFFTLGFMDTVRLEMSLSVVILSKDGTRVFEQLYTSGRRIDRFIAGSSPHTKLSALTHSVTTELLNTAAADTYRVLIELHATDNTEQ